MELFPERYQAFAQVLSDDELKRLAVCRRGIAERVLTDPTQSISVNNLCHHVPSAVCCAFFHLSGARKPRRRLAGHQNVQSLEIEGQANQTPFPGRRTQAAQRELPKAQDFFDETNNRFHGHLAQTIDRATNFSL